MIIVALGLMMDNADPGRYFRDVVSARSRERVIWKANLRRSDFYKRHLNRVAARHLETSVHYVPSNTPPPLRAA